MNRTTRTVLALVAATALAAGCSTQEAEPVAEAPTGSNRPDTVEPETIEPDAVVEPVPDPAPASTAVGFGEAWEYTNGLAVTVSPPEPFQASETAAGAEGYPAQVSFDVTIVNGSVASYDPSLAYITVAGGNTEGSEIFDFDNGVGGPPMTVVLPGREVTWEAAFAVDDATDLVVQVSPDSFDYEPAIFATNP